MFCRNCGNQLADDAKFCNKCGTAMKPVETAVPVATSAEPEVPVAPVQPEVPFTPEVPIEPAAPYIPEKPAKKGLPWWAVLLIVLGGLIVAIAAFVLVDGLANEGKLTESVIGVNFFASAEDDDDDEDSDKDKDEDGEEADDTDDTEDKDDDDGKDNDKDTAKDDKNDTQTDVKPAVVPYNSGLRTEDNWKSTFAELAYDLPEGFTMVSDEDISNYIQLGAETIFADADGQDVSELIKAKVVYEFMAMDGVGNNLIVMAEKVPVGTSPEKVLDGAKLSLKAMSSDSYKVEVGDRYLEVNLGGKTYYRMNIKITVGNVSYDQTMFLRVIGDRAFCLNFTYIGKAYFEDMLAGFSAY